MARVTVGDGGSAFKAPWGRWLVGALAVVGTALLAYALSPGLRADLGGLAALLGGVSATGVKDFVLSFGALSPIVYFFVVVAQVIASPIPAGPVTLAGALVFGVWEGLALSLAGSVVGSALVFLAVRRWGEPLVARLVGKEIYRKYVGRLDGKGWWLFAILLFPLMPDDAACALAGLSTLSFRRFLAVMVVGRIPGSTMTVRLASEWVTGSTTVWISVGILVAVAFALGFVYRERPESWVSRSAHDGRTGARFAPASREEESPREEPRWATSSPSHTMPGSSGRLRTFGRADCAPSGEVTDGPVATQDGPVPEDLMRPPSGR